MKRQLLFICFLLFTIVGKAQVTFIVNSQEGFPLKYTVIDALNRYVSVEAASKNQTIVDAEITVPSTVNKSGESEPYYVTEVAFDGFRFNIGSSTVKRITLPEGIKKIGGMAFLRIKKLTDFYFPSTLEDIGEYAFDFGCDFSVIDLSNTKLINLKECTFRNSVFSLSAPGVKIKLPQTLKQIGIGVFQYQKAIQLQIPSEVNNIEYDAFSNMSELKEIEFMNGVPATLTNGILAIPSSPFLSYLNNLQTIFVPVDCSKNYKTAEYWKDQQDKYNERLTIGSTGFTTYYLNNENFLVPAGCTAYIITGVTPSGNQALPDQAIVKAFGAGKIIPKQTGFVLQGPANSTVTYQANVTGAEEDVTGNLLVGTATGEEFSTTGKRYYVLAAGSQGMGFYKQGIREGKSINLPAHRAGLCLDASIARAKGLIIDFDAAREATGISSVNSDVQKKEDVIYDLQGRRVAHPSHGIYIINGKKVVK